MSRGRSRRAMMAFWPLLCALAGAAGAGCTGGTDGPGAPGEAWHRARNRGRLEASRETEEGYLAAAKAFEEALRLRASPSDELNRARCLLLAGRAEEARGALARLGGAFPPAGDAATAVLYLEGLAAAKLKAYAEAASKLEEVTRRAPEVEAAGFQLGSTLLLGGRPAEAVRAFDRLLERNPRHISAHYKRSMAYRALGDAAKAEEAMARFLELKQSEGQAAVDDAAYERCRFTDVALGPPAGLAPEPPEVPLDFQEAAVLGASAGPALEGVASAAPFDLEGDGDPDLYLPCRGPNRLLSNDRGRFADATELSDATDPGAGLAARPADFNNDSLQDLFVVNQGSCALLKGLGEGVFQPLAKSGLALEGVLEARWVDFDHDGDLDLAALVSAPAGGGLEARVHRNHGDESFAEAEGTLPGRIAGDRGAIALADLDRGNDIDLVVSSSGGPARAFLNLRSGPFRAEDLPGLPGCPALEACDVDGDGEVDLVGAPGPGAPLRIARSRGPAGAGKLPAFTVEDAAGTGNLGPASDLLLADLDNDGDADALAAGEKGLAFLRNRRGRLEREPVRGLEPERTGPVARAAALDVDLDGALDIVLVSPEGKVSLRRNASAKLYGAVTLRPVGGRDNRDALGAHVELLAGPGYQRRMVGAPPASGGTGGARFGLGETALDGIDGFEIVWPNGIQQPVARDELRWDSRRSLEVTQKRGLTVSCPFLYVHDGTGYRFLTDVVGIAPLDEWLPPGVEPRLDPEEYVRIPGPLLAASSGRVRLAVTEELRETTYLDRLRLIRVGHPPGTAVHTLESTRQGLVEPLRVWVVREGDLLAPGRVLHHGGRDGTREVSLADGAYLHPYDEGAPQWAGWVASHSVEIEPPEPLPGPEALLLLRGRIYWPDSSVVFALSQHGRSWDPPRLEALGPGGGILARIDDIGFPCGMDRTMVLPLEGAAGAARFRLVASHRFLWDQVAFARRSAPVELGEDGVREVTLGGETVWLERETFPILRAELGHHGFSRVVGDLERHEQTYDFERAEPSLRFRGPSGGATRPGDVTVLLEAADDRLAVLVPGDGVRVELAAPSS
ncbi:MAG: VCBS repeat-containing protein, partial [Planctomycetes bacterium]|nr:VCBS repeat-containing protein [Planctomycetota bacterium]